MPVTPEQLEEMSVLELVELKKSLEERWGVSAAAAAPVMVAGAAGPGGGDGAAAEEEQTSFDVVLAAAGPNKIPVIKVIRELTGLGLKEAKAVADEAPKPVKEGVAREEADQMKAKLEEAGATVEVK
ncbi:MAG TPA: 50S ribosomal protein L7/L12 [Gaiellales bacterium]|jgi:large subunit ribosomal protein L7/L12|nr:50S ribosomal protein L7/L12 [Gaiellales bacterium]